MGTLGSAIQGCIPIRIWPIGLQHPLAIPPQSVELSLPAEPVFP